MKYIKKYKIFESIHPNDAIKDYVDDILSPLSDDGIEVDTQIKEKRGVMTYIEIYITKRGGIHSGRVGFKLTPFIDELIHLNDYLEDQGWVLNSDPTVSDRDYDFDKWIANVQRSDNSYTSVPLFYVPKDNKVLRVISELSRDTVIDFDKEHIIFPFMDGYDPYPFAHLKPHNYIFFTTPDKPGRGTAVPPFIRYVRSKYGVTDNEMESVWDKYKHRMWERMIEPR